MAAFKIFKELVMPGTAVANAIYVVKSGTKFRITVTDNAGAPISEDSVTAAELAAAIATKENAFAAGTTLQYRRGDKTWQTLDKAAVGLGNVDNTSDANKPISTATATALAGKEATITAGTTAQYRRGDKTWQTLDKAAVGLANVDNTSDANKPISTAEQTALNLKEDKSAKGAVNGYAGLDGTGKVPTAQLPSYVDDVLEAANLAAFPGTGETGKIYVALDTNLVYRWTGTVYVKIADGAVTSVFGRSGIVAADVNDYKNFYVRHDAAQGLVDANKLIARNNIAAAGLPDDNAFTGKNSFSQTTSGVDAAGATDFVTLQQLNATVAASMVWASTAW